MNNQKNADIAHVIDCKNVRISVGILGLALPFVLYIGQALLASTALEDSLSAYYFTGMRNVLVGTLCAIGIFLYAYEGYTGLEKALGKLTCIFAIGVAFFPTKPPSGYIGIPPERVNLFYGLHLLFGGLLFLTLFYFCLAFTKYDKKRGKSPQKRRRNSVYFGCAGGIALGIAGILIVNLFPRDHPIHELHLILVFESLMIGSFGVAWLVKSEAFPIFRDKDQSRGNSASASTTA